MQVTSVTELGTSCSRNRGCLPKGKAASLVAQPKKKKNDAFMNTVFIFHLEEDVK